MIIDDDSSIDNERFGQLQWNERTITIIRW